MARKKRERLNAWERILSETPKGIPLTPEQKSRASIHDQLTLFTPIDNSRLLERHIQFTAINQKSMTGDSGYLLQNLNDLFAPIGVTFKLNSTGTSVEISHNLEPPHEIAARVDNADQENPTLNIRVDEQTFMELCSAWDHDPKSKLTPDGLNQWDAIKASTPRYNPSKKNTPAR